MTFTFTSMTIGRYHISINQEKFDNGFKVTACEERGGQYYTINENYYTDSKKANARFNHLVRKAAKNEL